MLFYVDYIQNLLYNNNVFLCLCVYHRTQYVCNEIGGMNNGKKRTAL